MVALVLQHLDLATEILSTGELHLVVRAKGIIQASLGNSDAATHKLHSTTPPLFQLRPWIGLPCLYQRATYMFCCPRHLTGFSGKGEPMGWNAQLKERCLVSPAWLTTHVSSLAGVKLGMAGESRSDVDREV